MTQELIPVKPNADWGLTRGGAHCQWLWVYLLGPFSLIKRATSAVAGVSPAATILHGGAARIRARGDGLVRGLAH